MILSYSFAGKKILITGGSRGIGRQLVQMFHDDGALVYTVARSADLIQKLREELPKVTAEIVDLNNWEETRKVVEGFGPMDYLVNNAGTDVSESFMEITEEAAKLQFNVNVSAIINISQVVAKGMIENGSGGSIVNMGASCWKFSPSCGVAVATKTALDSLTRTMAVELGVHNIRVNCVKPGFVNNVLDESYGMDPELVKWCTDTVEKQVVKRLIDPKEVGELIAFLLSPLSKMIVGEAIGIDGGYSIM